MYSSPVVLLKAIYFYFKGKDLAKDFILTPPHPLKRCLNESKTQHPSWESMP